MLPGLFQFCVSPFIPGIFRDMDQLYIHVFPDWNQLETLSYQAADKKTASNQHKVIPASQTFTVLEYQEGTTCQD